MYTEVFNQKGEKISVSFEIRSMVPCSPFLRILDPNNKTKIVEMDEVEGDGILIHPCLFFANCVMDLPGNGNTHFVAAFFHDHENNDLQHHIVSDFHPRFFPASHYKLISIRNEFELTHAEMQNVVNAIESNSSSIWISAGRLKECNYDDKHINY